jgi:hypothetical protein
MKLSGWADRHRAVGVFSQPAWPPETPDRAGKYRNFLRIFRVTSDPSPASQVDGWRLQLGFGRLQTHFLRQIAQDQENSMSLLLLIVIILLLFGGGGFYGHRAGYYGNGGIGIIGIIGILLIIYLFVGHPAFIGP